MSPVDRSANFSVDASGLGRLYLVPAPLDFGCAAEQQGPLQDVMPLGTLQTAARLQHWICENAKTARAYLKRVDAVVPLALPLQQLQLHELPRQAHSDHRQFHAPDVQNLRALLAPALAGCDMGLVSEAGMPAVADPGASVVRVAHALGLSVQVLVGPVSMLLALAASGLNGQNFAFVGYLPQDVAARGERIQELQALSRRSGQTQLMIETPYRNVALLKALLQHLDARSFLSLSVGLSLPQACTRSASVAQWRQALQAANATADPAVFLAQVWGLDLKLPAIFALGV